jgi:hypothetical protein
MRKNKIESGADIGRIKSSTNAPMNDTLAGVGGVNMLRMAVVLNLSAHVVSLSPVRFADRRCPID